MTTRVPANMLASSLQSYGAVGDGSTDDTAALILAFASGEPLTGGGPQYTYKVTAQIPLPGSVDFDGQGCTIKPTGNAPALTRNGPASVATTTVSSGATQASRQVVVASATGIVVGQYAYITADDAPTHDASSYPDFWGTVTNVAGTTITFDRPLPVTYSGTITYSAIAATSLADHALVRNVAFDGSACTYVAGLGQGARLGAYKRVLVDACRFINFTNNNVNTEALSILAVLDATVRDCSFTGQVGGNQQGSIYYSRNASLIGCEVSGSSFGLGIVRCENGLFSGNFASGLLKQESDEAVTLRSVRGLKAYGCASIIVTDNSLTDYESPIKIQACFRFNIRGNTLRNSAQTTFGGQVALNVGSITNGVNMVSGIIAHNIVDRSGGTGIGVTTDTPGKIVIQGNQVRDTYATGIYCNVRNAIVSDNSIENWNTGASTYVGLHYTSGATVTGNRFRNTNTGYSCLRVFLDATYTYCIHSNTSESGNPLSLVLENAGTAVITAAATSVAVTHGLSRTPTAEEVVITPTNSPTTDPGNTWISALGATTFTLNCRTAPGATTATFSWRAAIRQPFTA